LEAYGVEGLQSLMVLIGLFIKLQTLACLITDHVWAIAIDGQGNKWIGTYGGLAKFDGVNWTVYKTSNSGLPDNYRWTREQMVAIAIDGHSGELNGLEQMDWNKKRRDCRLS
jgi:hypothetical protein